MLGNGIPLSDLLSSLVKTRQSIILPPAIDFPQPQRKKTIASGGTETVYEERIPDGMVGFLRELAVEWDDDGLSWVHLDGMLWLQDPIDFPIGSVDDPIIFEPPYIIKHSIKIDIYNGTSASSEFRVYVGGLLFYKKREEEQEVAVAPIPEPSLEEIQQAILEEAKVLGFAKQSVEEYLLPPEAYTALPPEEFSAPTPFTLSPERKKISGDYVYDATS